ncbi:MAG: hypothetical protein ACT4PL_14595, partial [Phycisphaerales bacterium]
MALLRHDLNDGSWHHDWLLEVRGSPVGEDARVLMAVRFGAGGVGTFPDRAGVSGLGVWLPDHRRRSLDFEGPIGGVGGGRGIVQRLGQGVGAVVAESDGR